MTHRRRTPINIVVGTGYVGQRYLAQQTGDSAIGLNRNEVSTRQATEIFDLDTDSALPITLPDRYSVLYTVAPSPDFESDVRLQRLLTTLTTPPERFVYISTTGVYGDRNGERVDESSPPDPKTGRAKLRIAAEQLLQSWADRHHVDVVILRVPGLYGPQRLGIQRIRDGMPTINDREANPGNRIHVDDLVACCVAALSSEAPSGIYNVGDGDFRSPTWFSSEVARQCGLDAPPTVSRATAEREFSPLRLSFLKESRRADTTKMREVLGVTPRYKNGEDGIRASLAEENTSGLGRDVSHRK